MSTQEGIFLHHTQWSNSKSSCWKNSCSVWCIHCRQCHVHSTLDEWLWFRPQRVAIWIYWHALVLIYKGVTVYGHPKDLGETRTSYRCVRVGVQMTLPSSSSYKPSHMFMACAMPTCWNSSVIWMWCLFQPWAIWVTQVPTSVCNMYVYLDLASRNGNMYDCFIVSREVAAAKLEEMQGVGTTNTVSSSQREGGTCPVGFVWRDAKSYPWRWRPSQITYGRVITPQIRR